MYDIVLVRYITPLLNNITEEDEKVDIILKTCGNSINNSYSFSGNHLVTIFL